MNDIMQVFPKEYNRKRFENVLSYESFTIHNTLWTIKLYFQLTSKTASLRPN